MTKNPTKSNLIDTPPYRTLAPYACFADRSRGRLHKEEEAPNRSAFQRDRDRIIHSAAFRRLEYKTQVFVYHEGDHYRTRLTHSLEVAQLARSAARELELDEELAESLALAHDLGHPPFGHAGEDALKEVMEPFGGFDHNAQTLRVLTKLEQKYAGFDGLNLTWETLEGIAKHNGPVTGDLPRAVEDYVREHDLELGSYAGLEAQIAGLCDDIAYNSHDIDDGLRARLFTIEELAEVPVVGEIFAQVAAQYPGLDESRLVHESKRRMINRLVADLVAQTREKLAAHKISSVENIRALGRPIAHFSPTMQGNIKAIRAFLYEKMYRHYRVNRMTSKARRVVRELFTFFMEEPECLPPEWMAQIDIKGSQEAAEVICDYIAGMTDRYAFEEHRRVFDLSYKLIGG